MASLGMTTVSMLSKVRVILVLVVQVRHQLRKQNVGPVDFTGTIQPIRAISTSRPVLISVMTGRLAQMQIGVFTHSPDVPPEFTNNGSCCYAPSPILIDVAGNASTLPKQLAAFLLTLGETVLQNHCRGQPQARTTRGSRSTAMEMELLITD